MFKISEFNSILFRNSVTQRDLALREIIISQHSRAKRVQTMLRPSFFQLPMLGFVNCENLQLDLSPSCPTVGGQLASSRTADVLREFEYLLTRRWRQTEQGIALIDILIHQIFMLRPSERMRVLKKQSRFYQVQTNSLRNKSL
jgi:hypothetical protein